MTNYRRATARAGTNGPGANQKGARHNPDFIYCIFAMHE